MRFKLRQMEVFRAVMLTGSVSGAARMLYVSQPAVSKLLAHTETSLGLRLFHRTGGKLVPTDAAQRLFQEVQHVYDAAQQVDRFVENLAVDPSETIKLSSSPSLGLSVMPRVISRFRERYPSVRIQFHTTLIQDVPLELLSGKTDMALTVLPVDAPNLQVEPVMQGRMVCALPARHALTRKQSLSLFDLEDQTMILYSSSIPFGRLIYAAFQHHQCQIRAAIDVPRAELACSLVRQGLGIAIVDEFSVAGDMWSGLAVRPLAEEIPIAVSLIRSGFHVPSDMTEAFVRTLRAELRG